MKKSSLLVAALCIAAIMMVFGGTRAVAGGGPCVPCPDWWVEYDYIFPPCSDPVTVDVQWANGLWSNVVSTTDGHIIYPTPHPISTPTQVLVNGVVIPLNWQKVKIPYTCSTNPPMPGFCLEVEVRCNPCLEIKIKLVPC